MRIRLVRLLNIMSINKKKRVQVSRSRPAIGLIESLTEESSSSVCFALVRMKIDKVIRTKENGSIVILYYYVL